MKRNILALLFAVLLAGLALTAYAEQDREQNEEAFAFDAASDEELLAYAKDCFERGELRGFVASLSQEQLVRYRRVTDGTLDLMEKAAQPDKKAARAKAGGSTVYVGRDEEKIDGGQGVTTHNYWVKTSENGETLAAQALCVNASNAGPRGQALPYAKLDDGAEQSIVLKAALVRAFYPELIKPASRTTDQSDPAYSDLVWFWFDGSASAANIICKCHALASYVYSGDLGGSNGVPAFNETILNEQLLPMVRSIKRWYADNTDGFADVLDRCTLYVAYGDGLYRNGIPLQSIAWIEYHPNGFLRAAKQSSRSTVSEDNAAYTTKGIQFKVYTDADCTVQAKNAAGKTFTLTVADEDFTQTVEIAPGTYWVREVEDSAAGRGWIWNDRPVKVTVGSENGTAATAAVATVKNEPQTGYLCAKKVSALPACTRGNPCYDLSGITFKVYADAACSREARDADGKKITLESDAAGETGAVEMALGTYWVRETEASVKGRGWAWNSRPVKVTVTAGTQKQAKVAEIENRPLNDPAGIVIEKTDEDGSVRAGWDLSGAAFTVSYYAGRYTLMTLPGKADAVWVIQTKKTGKHFQARLADGFVLSGEAKYGKSDDGNFVIPLGTLTIEETKAPEDFTLEGATLQLLSGDGSDAAAGKILIDLTDRDGVAYALCKNQAERADDGFSVLVKERPEKGGLSIQKTDAKTGEVPQGDASFAGIRFAVINRTGKTFVNRDGKEIAAGQVAQIITTNASGKAATRKTDLVTGRYEVTEMQTDDRVEDGVLVRGNSGMANGTYVWKKRSQVVQVNADVIVPAGEPYENEPAPFVPKAWKLDADTGTRGPQPGFTFLGIEFTLYNRSGHPVVIDGKTVGVGKAAAVVTVDDTGKLALPKLPFGTYSLKETKTNAMYELDETEQTFRAVLLKDGSIACEPAELTFADRPVRGGFSFVKTQAETGSPLPFIPFRLTCLTTGETHFLLTAADGSYDSEASAHSAQTNGADAALAGFTRADIIPASVIAELPKDAGLWFGPGKTADDRGALPVGTYLLEELKCEANRDRNMITRTFSIKAGTEPVNLGKVENEQVRIRTAAAEKESRTQYAAPGQQTVIVDRVAYENLIPGEIYELTAELFLLQPDGSLAPWPENGGTVSRKAFTPQARSGDTEVELICSTEGLEGRRLVVYETLRVQATGEFAAEHRDAGDTAQMIFFPEIETEAADAASGTDHALAEETVTVTDCVTYRALIPGRTYTLRGTLTDAADGKPLETAEGPVTAERSFTPESPDGEISLAFTLPAALCAGKRTVVFETLLEEEREIAVHADITDEGQSVWVPRIRTQAAAADTGERVTAADEQTQITDLVWLEGLKPGTEYRIEGMLVNGGTGEPIHGEDGEEVRASAVFTAAEESRQETLSFVFNAAALAGTRLVVTEELFAEGRLVGRHADLADESQTVTLPQIRTRAGYGASTVGAVRGRLTGIVTDTVAYRGLLPGKTYRLEGVLMDADTGKPVRQDGAVLTAKKEFCPEEPDGSVELNFYFDNSVPEGKTLVVFETCYLSDAAVAVHADLTDRDQTVRVPALSTTALAEETRSHAAPAAGVTIKDTVQYRNLEPERAYRVCGSLYLADTGEPFLQDGKPVRTERAFTPSRPDGEVEVFFEIDAHALAGRTLVVFEELWEDQVLVGMHADLSDAAQSIRFPAVYTDARDRADNDKVLKPGETVVLTDTVTWQNLIPGSSYVLCGRLMDRETGDSLGITAIASFTAKEADGTATVDFVFDTSGWEGRELVVFEELQDENCRVVAVHEDLDDEGQTVKVADVPEETTPEEPETTPETPPSVKTGDDLDDLRTICTALVSAAGFGTAAVLFGAIRRKRKDD